MKKFEALEETHVPALLRLFALGLLVLSAAARADEPPPVPSAPPLVPTELEPAGEPAPGEQPAPRQENEAGVLKPAAIANPPLDVNPETATKATPSRLPRIGAELLLGATAGALGGIGAGLLGHALWNDQFAPPLGGTWFGASVGFAVLAPIGVWLVGKWLDGNGSWWTTLVGDLVGAAVGAASVIFGGPEATPVLFALPLAGSLIGYEMTSEASAAKAQAPAPKVSLGVGARNGVTTLSVLGSF